jgi:type I restriction enzyme S subunit
MARYKFDQIAFNSTDKKKPVDEDKKHYIGLEHLDSGSLKVTRWGSEIAPKGEKLLMRKGDVLFGKRRAYQKKVAIAPFDGIFSAHGMVLRPKTEVIDPDFFPLFIASDYFLDAAIKISVGSLSPTINWRDLKELEFDIPSLPVQKKLAKILWAINDTKGAYEQLIQETDELVKSQFIEMFGPIDQESHWKRVPWKKVLNIINGKDYKKVPCDKGTYPVYGTGGEMARVDEYLCPENSVLVGRKGTIDHPLLVKEKFWNVDTAFGLVPNENLNYEYLYWFCLQFDFWSINKGTTLPSTTKADLEKIEINVPPVELQNQFATIVHQSDKSKFELNEAIKDLDAMYKRIIKDNLG